MKKQLQLIAALVIGVLFAAIRWVSVSVSSRRNTAAWCNIPTGGNCSAISICVFHNFALIPEPCVPLLFRIGSVT